MLNRFNKTISIALTNTSVAISIAVASFGVSAQDSCHVKLESGFSINKTAIEFFNPENKNQPIYSIKNDKTLLVNKEEVSLNIKQQVLIAQYSMNIRTLVPKASAIAIEGIDSAIKELNVAFNDLLGEGNNAAVELIKKLTVLRDEVANHYSIAHGFSIGENGLADGDLLESEFKQQIESKIKKIVTSSMGSIMMAAGMELVNSGGRINDLGARMQKFTASMQHNMKQMAEKTKRKSQRLCTAVIAVDSLEKRIKKSIHALAKTNVLTVHSSTKVDEKSR